MHLCDTKNEPSDEVLMLNYSNSDCVACFTKLFEKYNRNMIGLIIYQSRCSEDVAQDIVASTWEKLIKNKSKYKPLAKFSTYLYTILHNNQADYYRKQNRVSWLNIDDVNNLTATTENNQFLLDILQSEFQVEIYHAINSLPKEQALVISLYYLEGFKIKEISEITNVSIECTKSRLRYAKKGVKNYLQMNDIDAYTVKSYLKQLELI